MGLLTLDVTPAGLVMASDSQPVLLREFSFQVPAQRDSRDKIVLARLDGFRGLIGYVGTEHIGSTPVRSWVEAFVLHHQSLSLASFCEELARTLSDEWSERELDTCLWVFVAGYESIEARFWFIVNGDLDPTTGLYHSIGNAFRAVDDLDGNYITSLRKADLRLTKRRILETATFWFRNGALIPPMTEIVDAFNELAERLHTGRYPGFVAVRSLSEFAYIARQRLECTKRLYSPKHGIYARPDPPIHGTVYVYSVAPDGEFAKYPLKDRERKLR